MAKLLFLIWYGGVSGMVVRVECFRALENLRPRIRFLYGVGGWGFGMFWVMRTWVGKWGWCLYLAVNGDV